ncbi:hypothetical protein EV426DRAFT_706890 [Tirmania nivea]|nr:hypothetical protein EV426DRAFT_706890 [Tirmania nivea]
MRDRRRFWRLTGGWQIPRGLHVDLYTTCGNRDALSSYVDALLFYVGIVLCNALLFDREEMWVERGGREGRRRIDCVGHREDRGVGREWKGGVNVSGWNFLGRDDDDATDA